MPGLAFLLYEKRILVKKYFKRKIRKDAGDSRHIVAYPLDFMIKYVIITLFIINLFLGV